jgi:hypothetical protein
MGLIDTMRDALAGDAASFQLMGEDLTLVTGASLRAAAAEHEAGLAAMEAPLRARFEAEQAALLTEAHAWLRRHNTSVRGRVAGYVALGRACDFVYPWPVIAVLGICQVMEGMQRNRLHGLIAPVLERLGVPALASLVDRSDDVLRRTNRGIFADSVPTVLLGLRAHRLRACGDAALADALLRGPLPPIFDEESRALAIGIDRGLGVADEADRFAALAELTLRHFAREQAIFTHHMGTRSRERAGSRAPNGAAAALMRRLTAVHAVPAPVVVRGASGRRVEFHRFALPVGFEMRDHDARVAQFGRAFVTSVTADREDYAAATRHVLARFGGA